MRGREIIGMLIIVTVLWALWNIWGSNWNNYIYLLIVAGTIGIVIRLFFGKGEEKKNDY